MTTSDSVRVSVIAGLRKKLAANQPILGRHLNPLADDKPAVADLFALSHTAMLPSLGLMGGLMPFGDANRMVMELGSRAVSAAKATPVLASVAAGDPFRLNQFFLKEIKEAGFTGVQNFPSVGVMDGPFRAHLESSGGGYAREVELIRAARQLDLLTAALVFNADEATRMAEAGSDILVVHAPLSASGFLQREAVVTALRRVIDSVRGLREDVILICGSYWETDLEAGRNLFDACPGFDGYWTANESAQNKICN